MIISMTGYGNAEIEKDGVLYSVELRSVNSKFFDLSIKLPKNHSSRENDFRDLIRNKITRGKITLSANIHKKNVVDLPIQINSETIKFLKALFKDLKKATGLKEKIKLDHYLRFSEIFGYKEEELSDSEFKILMECAEIALDKLLSMKLQEGKELEKDISQRIRYMDGEIEKIQSIWKEKEDTEWKRLQEKAIKLLEGREPDIQRIETELVLLLDRMDITEECVRFGSHSKFFIDAMVSTEPSGKKLNFLTQEMLREANTIASKSNSAEISQAVVRIKEELEKVREQLQNVE